MSGGDGCREYLGREVGYCGQPATEDIGGRLFCDPHLTERRGVLRPDIQKVTP